MADRGTHDDNPGRDSSRKRTSFDRAAADRALRNASCLTDEPIGLCRSLWSLRNRFPDLDALVVPAEDFPQVGQVTP